MRVLVVEDHVRLADSVARVLRREGMAVDVAYDGTATLDRTGEIDYDVVVLDRDLPGVPGGVGATLVIGGLAGFCPAMRAARMAPTEAPAAP